MCKKHNLPGTPNNHFLMDVWWFPTISHVKIWFIIQLKQPAANQDRIPRRQVL